MFSERDSPTGQENLATLQLLEQLHLFNYVTGARVT